MHTGSAHLNLGGGVATGHARGLTPLARDATVEEKIEALDGRTIRLHKEIGELEGRLRKSDREVRREIASVASELRHEIHQTQASVDELSRQTIHADAGALPVIVLGVVLSGMSPDADLVPMWLGLIVLLGVIGVSVRISWGIFSTWRAERSRVS